MKSSKGQSTFSRALLIIIGCLIVASCIITTTSAVDFRVSHVSPGESRELGSLTKTEVPSHPNPLTKTVPPPSEGVNVYALRNAEPAPMGIADYGIGSNGPYSYSTTSFLGIARIYSLTTQNSTGDRSMSFQLNVELKFTSSTGQQFSYWIQDVADYYTNVSALFFLDNVWNSSSPTAKISSSAISGSGQVATISGGNSFYYDRGNNYADYIGLPAVVEFKVVSSINSQSEPQVSFEYNYQGTWQTFDTVSFPVTTSTSLDSGFLVDGSNYNPYGTFYDAELVLAGVAGGWNTTDTQSNVELQLQFWNGHNFQEIYNAYNFGSNTAEGISNVASQSFYFPVNGSLEAQVSAVAGTLGSLYQQSQISFISVQSALDSGTLYIANSSSSSGNGGAGYPFTGKDVTITISPGTYKLYVYDGNGVLVAQGNETVTAGQNLQLTVNTSSGIALTVSYSVVGGSPANAPSINYVLNGQQEVAQLNINPTIIYADPGSQWSVSSGISGSSQFERWQTNQATSGIVSSAQTINIVYYHQEMVSFGFSVMGGSNGGSLSPTLNYQTFGAENAASVSLSAESIWVDVSSAYSYSSILVRPSGTERWIALQTSTAGIISQNTFSELGVSPTYYHQYLLTLSYSLVGGGSFPSDDLYYSAQRVYLSAPLSVQGVPIWADAGSSYNFSSFLLGSEGERWVTNASGTGMVTGPTILTPKFYHQFAEDTYYSILDGGGNFSSPALTSTSEGHNYSQVITSQETSVWLDAGVSWTVSNSLQGSATLERWIISSNSTGSVGKSGKIAPIYYHQFYVTLRYSTQGGRGPSLSINLTRIGTSVPVLLNASMWVDAGSSYNYPQVLLGSNSTSRWMQLGAGSVAVGIFGAQKNITITYMRQFLVSITSTVLGGSSPSRSGWYNASGTVTLTETNDSGWGNGGWNGSGSGSYSGLDASQTLAVKGPIIEQPIFLPALTLAASNGGSISYSYGSSSGKVDQGESITLYVPSGTQFSLSTTPASFLNSFQQWSGNNSASISTLNMKVLSPSHLEAQFGYNYGNIGLIGGIPIVAVIFGLVFVYFRKHGAKPSLSV